MAKMLVGDEKIKDICKDDICNYLGFSLGSAGVVGVHIDPITTASGSYDVLYVYFKSGRFCRVPFNDKRALNISINGLKNIILKNVTLNTGASD